MALGVLAVREVPTWPAGAYTIDAWQEANPHRDGREVAQLPLLEEHPCPFADEPHAQGVRCATLVVAADRGTDAAAATEHGPAGTELGPAVMELAVAILPATGTARSDPVLYLEGGPGGASVAWFDDWMRDGWPSRADRDLVLLDQRGTGYSSPQLGCPEYLEAVADEELDALRTCHDRFVADGVDLATVSTPAHAADVEDLRVALGVEHWNLLGTSYGSRVALRVVERYPDSVRSVILDSAYPPEVEALYEEAENAVAAIEVLLAACAADAACAAAYPDLAERFAQAIARLDADPVEIDGVAASGRDLVSSVVQALYDPTLIPQLPRLIDLTARDPEAGLEELFDDLGYLAYRRGTVETFRESDGTFYSVECREEAATIDREEALRRARAVDGPARDAAAAQVELTLDICASWSSGRAERWERDRVVSDVPALILAGAFDPVTPIAWGERAAAGLTNGTLVTFPDLGHALVLGGDCPVGLMQAFVHDPTRVVDTACVEGRTVRWEIR